MKLREKTLAIIGITLVGLIIILYLATQTIVENGYSELEEQTTRQNVERVLNTISDDFSKMDSTTYDWAAWDDTYYFVQDANAEYIDRNLMDDTFVILRFNVMMFVSPSGEIVYKKAVNLDSETEMIFPESLTQYVSSNPFLIDFEGTVDSVSGLVLLPEGPMLVVSRPIVTSLDEGPIGGALITGRFLDSAEIERLQTMAQLSLAFYEVGSELPSDVEAALPSLVEGSIYVNPLSETSVAGYTLITDIQGEPILVLRVDMPRNIYSQCRASMIYLLVSIIFTGMVFGAVMILLLENQMLSRLSHLSKSVSSISERSDLSARVQMKGEDELSNLADEINKMIETIEHSSKTLQDSLEEKEVLLREIHHRVKNNMQIITSLLNLQSAYISDKKTVEMFKESQNRIRTMALIHEKLYKSKDLAKIDLKEYLRSLTTDLIQSYGEKVGRITFKVDAEDISLGIDTAIPCGLIINELISNALKYAFPDNRKGEIRVAFHRNKGKVELIVADNGVGLPENINLESAESLGLRLVSILVRDQLHGTVHLERDGGTEFRIVFKI